MNDERSFERTTRAWLELGANQAPDRTVQAVLLAIDTTPQERDLRIPWRFPRMNKFVAIGLGTAAVVLVLVLGVQLVGQPAPSGVGGAPSVEPSATAEPSAPAAPSPSAQPVPPSGGQLAPGTYAFSDVDPPIRTLVPFTFEVPAGWSARSGDLLISKGGETAGEVSLSPFVVTHVYTDACDSAGTLTEVGPTVDALVGALVDQVNSEATTPVDVEVGGYPAKLISMSIPTDLDTATCRHPDDRLIQVWADAAETDFFAIADIPAADPRGGVYIVDVDGERVVILTTYSAANSSATDIAELEAIIASIRFEP